MEAIYTLLVIVTMWTSGQNPNPNGVFGVVHEVKGFVHLQTCEQAKKNILDGYRTNSQQISISCIKIR